jgi:branched-chain amino acid transport system permease protein
MDQLYGYYLYGLSLITFGGIYAILTLGLNIQWGFTGLFNAGIAGFFAIGAYVTAILTTPYSDRHLGGFDLPIAVGVLAAMAVTAAIGWLVGRTCIRLRSDYLAIATLGIGEIFRLILKNETDYTNGARGVSFVPKPFEAWESPWDQMAMAGVVLLIVLVLYIFMERARTSPWGRVMAAIRENEPASLAAGKNVERFRIEAFVIGAAFMGLGGAMMAHYIKFVDPQLSDPLTASFLVFVMLIVGGSGNNKGAILGAMLLWTVWSASEPLARWIMPDFLGWDNKAPYLRVFLIGLVLQIVLQKYSTGILPEKRLQSLAETGEPSPEPGKST